MMHSIIVITGVVLVACTARSLYKFLAGKVINDKYL